MSIGLLVIVLLLIGMWFLLIRPARRRQAQQQDVLSQVEVGDEIVTAGGLYGEVESIEDDELRVQIAPGTTVRLARRAVAAIIQPEEPEEEIDEEEEEPEVEPRELEAGAPEEDQPAGEEASSGSARR